MFSEIKGFVMGGWLSMLMPVACLFTLASDSKSAPMDTILLFFIVITNLSPPARVV